MSNRSNSFSSHSNWMPNSDVSRAHRKVHFQCSPEGRTTTGPIKPRRAQRRRSILRNGGSSSKTEHRTRRRFPGTRTRNPTYPVVYMRASNCPTASTSTTNGNVGSTASLTPHDGFPASHPQKCKRLQQPTTVQLANIADDNSTVTTAGALPHALAHARSHAHSHVHAHDAFATTTVANLPPNPFGASARSMTHTRAMMPRLSVDSSHVEQHHVEQHHGEQHHVEQHLGEHHNASSQGDFKHPHGRSSSSFLCTRGYSIDPTPMSATDSPYADSFLSNYWAPLPVHHSPVHHSACNPRILRTRTPLPGARAHTTTSTHHSACDPRSTRRAPESGPEGEVEEEMVVVEEEEVPNLRGAKRIPLRQRMFQTRTLQATRQADAAAVRVWNIVAVTLTVVVALMFTRHLSHCVAVVHRLDIILIGTAVWLMARRVIVPYGIASTYR